MQLFRWHLVAAISAALAALLLYWFRDPQAFVSPQFWAEDGMIFWLEQYTRGWRAIFIPYAGTSDFAPRVTAFLASFFDPSYAPRLYATAAIAFTCWSAATAATAIESPLIGFLFGLAIMLPPNPSGEMLGTVSDAQWFLAPTLALIAATDSRTSLALRLNRVLFTAIAGLTGPFSIFTAPLAARRFWKHREWDLGLIVICGLLQAVIVLLHPFDLPVWHELGHNIEMEVLRLFPTLSVNVAAGGFTIAAFLLIAPGRELRLQLIGFAGLLLLATAWKARVDPTGFEDPVNLSRYFYVPQVILIWCAISLTLSSVVGAVIGSLWFTLSIWTYPTQWFFAALKPDMHWPQQILDLGKRDLVIPISPNPDWTVRIPVNQNH